MTQWLPFVLPVIAVPIVWFGTVWLIGFFSGWRRLARVYPLTQPIENEKTIGLQQLKIGLFTNYNNCITFGFSDKGMSLRLMFLFRFGHPPIFIPWEDVLAEKTTFFKYFQRVRLILLKAPGRQLFIRPKQAEKYAQLAGDYWPKYETIE